MRRIPVGVRRPIRRPTIIATSPATTILITTVTVTTSAAADADAVAALSSGRAPMR